LDKYADKDRIYAKGTPIHVKGALLFNALLKKHNIKNIPPINDGDKVKFCYLRTPNPLIYDTVIAVGDFLPQQFEVDPYVDAEKQFEKGFLDPLKIITDTIGWQVEQKQTLEDFFQ
jgi:hypothetical protein